VADGYGWEPHYIEDIYISVIYRGMARYGIAWRSPIMTLPRLGSRVRIPSPAPIKGNENQHLRASSGDLATHPDTEQYGKIPPENEKIRGKSGDFKCTR